MTDHKNIHEAINAVMGEVGYVQKQKSDKLSYTYLGEAGLIEALRPSMVEHGIYVTVSRIIKIYRDNYVTKSGTAMTSTVVHGEVKFTHVSGTSIRVQATGEGADSGDKSANKAMTGMYKYALRQTFAIETGDDPDQFSSDSMERASRPATKPLNAPKRPQEAEEKPEIVKDAEELADSYTGNQILAKSDLVKELTSLTGKSTVEVCKFVGALEKGKKFTVGQIVKAINETVQ